MIVQQDEVRERIRLAEEHDRSICLVRFNYCEYDHVEMIFEAWQQEELWQIESDSGGYTVLYGDPTKLPFLLEKNRRADFKKRYRPRLVLMPDPLPEERSRSEESRRGSGAGKGDDDFWDS